MESIDTSQKVQGELALANHDKNRLPYFEQSATLDAYIFERTAENQAFKTVENARIIASLSAAQESTP